MITRRIALPACAASAFLCGLTGAAGAEGFGTPTIDGVIDAVYGDPEATDPTDDAPQGFEHLDLGRLYVCNDVDYWYFAFEADDDVLATNWGKYMIEIDTTNDAAGATVDAWGRNVVISDPHKPEFSLRSWVDGGGAYSAAKTQVWAWDGASWSTDGALDDAAVAEGTTSVFEWKVAKTRIGSPSTIWCEVFTTAGGGGDNAQDTSNDPADDWNATDWTTTAVLANSTEVAETSGSDVTPPTLVSVTGIGQDPITDLLLEFSEALEQLSAETTGNYSIDDTAVTILSAIQDTIEPRKVTLVTEYVPAPAGEGSRGATGLPYGQCFEVTVTGVEDVAGNPIVDDGISNVAGFQLWSLTFRANMNLRLRDVSYFPDTEDVGLEGSQSPLTWDPVGDLLLDDADGDSVYTATVQFSFPCESIPAPGGNTLEYKFTHKGEYESIGNHFYAFDPLIGEDVLNIWWNDVAPSDITANVVDVIWTVDTSGETVPPVDGVDVLALNGSQLPLNWDVPPLGSSALRDNGVAPDDTAGDDIWSIRVRFPVGTFRTVYHKFVLNDVYECEDQDNRSITIDDATYSDTNPQILDTATYDQCVILGVEDASLPRLQMVARPNPSTRGTFIAFTTDRETDVRVTVHDVQGRQVRELEDGPMPIGRTAIFFDGRDAGGRALASGTYYVRIETADGVETRPLTLMR